MKTQVRRHLLLHLIWVYTACEGTIYRMHGWLNKIFYSAFEFFLWYFCLYVLGFESGTRITWPGQGHRWGPIGISMATRSGKTRLGRSHWPRNLAETLSQSLDYIVWILQYQYLWKVSKHVDYLQVLYMYGSNWCFKLMSFYSCQPEKCTVISSCSLS